MNKSEIAAREVEELKDSLRVALAVLEEMSSALRVSS
jgi:hypothetical protein